MTYHAIRDVGPAAPGELECAQSRLGRVIVVLVLAGLLVGLFFIPADGAFRYWRWLIAAFIFLFFWMFLTLLRRSFGPERWLMRINPRGDVWIKFRSYANEHFSDDDEVILRLARDDIEWVGMLTERWIRPRSEAGARGTRESSTYIEIRLREGIDVKELDRRLAEERARRGPGKYVRTVNLDYPVRLVDERTLRVAWRDRMSRVVPGAKRALVELGVFAKVRDERETTTDLCKPAADRAAQETQIIELLERGDKMGAIHLTRRCYGCSLAEARNFVEGLAGSTTSGAADTRSR